LGTPFSDAETGMAGTVLTRQQAPLVAGGCGSFSQPATVDTSGSSTLTVTGLTDGCHRFVLAGTDLAGNVSRVSSTVLVDASAPSGGTLTVDAVAATPSGSVGYTSVAGVNVAWSHFTDQQSGMSSGSVTRTRSAGLSDGVCQPPYGSLSTLASSLSPSSGSASDTLPTSGRCYEYILSGTNAFGLTSTTRIVIWFDSSDPTSSGQLRVNNTNASSGGRTSRSNNGTYDITSLRTFADGQSGIVSDVLTRTRAPLAGNGCGAFDPTSTVVMPLVVPATEVSLPPGCYLYEQTGTNGVGSKSSVQTTVIVG
jgi:hypothetical protein